jgi:hypothetical protein
VKNQYFGDRNDYFKYDLLIFLGENLSGIKRLSAIWMLTQNDKSSDGDRRQYSTGTFRDSLYEFLKDSNRRNRQVSLLKDYFKNRKFQFSNHSLLRPLAPAV